VARVRARSVMSALHDDQLRRFQCWLCSGMNVTHVHKLRVILSTCRDCGARRKTPGFDADDKAYFGQPGHEY
jgi:hypothetical protein